MSSPASKLAAHPAATRCVPDGVGEQVRDDPAQALDVEAGAERVRRLDLQVDLAVGRERLEGLGDRPYRASQIRVHERESRFAVVGLDLLEHVVDLFERAERGDPDVNQLRARFAPSDRSAGVARSG